MHVWMPITPKPIKALNSLDSSRPNRRLSQNAKTGGLRELFLPENDFKTCSTVMIQILEAWKPTEGMKLRLEFFCACPSTYKLNKRKNCFGHLMETSSKCNKFWRENLKKISQKGKTTEFYNFLELYIPRSANPKKIICDRLKLLLVRH